MNINDLSKIEQNPSTKVKKRKSKVRILQNEAQEMDHSFAIDASFPPRVNRALQNMLEYRLQLKTKYPIYLNGGDFLVVETNCFIQEDAKANMYVKANPNIPLLCEELYVKCENQNLGLNVYNVSDKVVQIPKNVCIAYLIVNC